MFRFFRYENKKIRVKNMKRLNITHVTKYR